MIQINQIAVSGWDMALSGIHNTITSQAKSDSRFDVGVPSHVLIGPNDHTIMSELAKKDSSKINFKSMVIVNTEITAPLYWWKDFDAYYKIGTIVSPYSIIERIYDRPFGLNDFSAEDTDKKVTTVHSYVHIPGVDDKKLDHPWTSYDILQGLIGTLNHWRWKFINAADSDEHDYAWQQMIQLIPMSYNQKRTLMVNYDVLSQIYKSQRNRKMNEWRDFCEWIKTLPYSEIILSGKEKNE